MVAFRNYLSPHVRRLFMENFVRYSPEFLLRFSEAVFDLPIRRSVRAHRSLFIHIPKNAGTTISGAMYGCHIGHRSAQWYRKADRAMFESKYKFAVVRDPVDRFISSFYFVSSGGTAEIPTSTKSTRLVSGYRDISSFIDAVEFGEIRNFKSIDPVFDGQKKYIIDEYGNIIIDKIFDFSNISGKIIDVPGIRIDMSEIRNKTTGIDYSKVIYDDIRKFVEKYYEDDVVLYDGCRK